MSATIHTASDRGEAVYGRLFREGRADVLSRLGREFPDVSPHDREDTASLALLDMIRARKLTRWETGAVGLWGEMARQRMVNKFVHDRRREQRARLEPLTEDAEVAATVTPHDEIEAALSDWRAVELMAQMSPRAATFVRLRVLEGGSRADVMAATGWSGKQYEKAQSAAKTALRSALADLDSPRSCGQYRRLVDRRALGAELAARKQAALHAHVERCGSCRAYSSEAHRTLHGVAPLVALVPASAAGGGALVAAGSIGVGVPAAGVVAKGTAILCAGALCVGGAYFALHGDGDQPRPRQHTSAAVEARSAPAVTDRRPAVTAPAAKPTAKRRARDDALGLGGGRPEPAAPMPELDPAKVQRRPPAAAESAFGLGAAPPAPPAPSTACAPGELGC